MTRIKSVLELKKDDLVLIPHYSFAMRKPEQMVLARVQALGFEKYFFSNEFFAKKICVLLPLLGPPFIPHPPVVIEYEGYQDTFRKVNRGIEGEGYMVSFTPSRTNNGEFYVGSKEITEALSQNAEYFPWAGVINDAFAMNAKRKEGKENER